MHYYTHNIGDYRRDTVHLSLLEHGIYRQLLDSYYLNEKPLTLNHADLMRTHSVRNADEMQALENLLNDFFVRTDLGYVHKRCDVEIETFHSKSKAASESAKIRWQRRREEENANAMRTHSEGNANHKPITINHKPITNNQEQNSSTVEPTESINPNNSVLRVKEKIKKEIAPASPLPDWVNPDLWVDFCNAKKKIHGSKWSQSMHDYNLKELVKLHGLGHDANEIIQTTIANGWKGFFPPKATNQGKGAIVQVNGVQRTKEVAQTLDSGHRWMEKLEGSDE